MKRYLIRLCLVGSLLCSILLGSSTKGQGGVEGCQHDQQQLKQHDGWIHHVAEESERAPVSLLRTTAIYNPTNSVIDAKSFEYSPADGERLKRLLESPAEQLSERMGDFRPEATVNGNYMAEVCQSHDGAFLAVQLFQFISMSYEPVTEVLLFEGSAAGIVGQLF